MSNKALLHESKTVTILPLLPYNVYCFQTLNIVKQSSLNGKIMSVF